MIQPDSRLWSVNIPSWSILQPDSRPWSVSMPSWGILLRQVLLIQPDSALWSVSMPSWGHPPQRSFFDTTRLMTEHAQLGILLREVLLIQPDSRLWSVNIPSWGILLREVLLIQPDSRLWSVSIPIIHHVLTMIAEWQDSFIALSNTTSVLQWLLLVKRKLGWLHAGK